MQKGKCPICRKMVLVMFDPGQIGASTSGDATLRDILESQLRLLIEHRNRRGTKTCLGSGKIPLKVDTC